MNQIIAIQLLAQERCLGWGRYKKEDLDVAQVRVNQWLRNWMYERWLMGLPDMQTPTEFLEARYAKRNQIYQPVVFAL
jgi:hypothetical protein